MPEEAQPDSKHEERSEDSVPAEEPDNTTESTKEETATTSKVSRKRTKTGCLTCRKRRIKCGEERPICANCIKSKRSCEGYNQPVVFKPGLSTIRPGMSYAVGYGPYPIQPATSSHFQPIAPAPPAYRQTEFQQPVLSTDRMIADDTSLPPHIEVLQQLRMQSPPQGQYVNHTVRAPPLSPNSPQSAGFQQGQAGSNPYFQHSPSSETFSNPPSTYSEPRTLPYQHHSSTAPTTPLHAPPSSSTFVPGHQSTGNSCPFNPPLDPRYSLSRRQSNETYSAGPSNDSPTPTVRDSYDPPVIIDNSFGYQQLQPSPTHESTIDLSVYQDITTDPSFSAVGGTNYYDQQLDESEGQVQMPEYQPEQGQQGQGQQRQEQSDQAYYGQQQRQRPQTQQPRPRIQVQQVYHGHYEQQQQTQTYYVQSQTDETYDENAYSDMDQDSDASSDEDDAMIEAHSMLGPSSVIYRLIEPYAISAHGSGSAPRMITYSTYLPDAQALRAYYPSYSASPLMNPTTAKIFCHFVFVLGPSLSIFERTSPNPGLAFSSNLQDGMGGEQNIWSYTIPMLSLQHPPLLHALLALSSLHLAKLTRSVENSALLHYNIALRRLGKAIGNEKMRGETSTLAATLLLAFYETMAGEHNKWSRHIHGAKLLIQAIDFKKLNERIEYLKEEAKSKQFIVEHTESVPSARTAENRRMLAIKKGRRNERDADEGRTRANRTKKKRKFSRKELENSLLQSDLFWWYCKMDAFQSILSGGPLVLDYIFWSQCPPRSNVNTLGPKLKGSDDFILLLGRVADFQARDMNRKKKVEKANGGMWVPPPDMGGPPRGLLWRMGRGGGAGTSQMGAGGMGMRQRPEMGSRVGSEQRGASASYGPQGLATPTPGPEMSRRPSDSPMPGGPPPGWTGGPPPGWTGGPPPGNMGDRSRSPAEMVHPSNCMPGPASGLIGPNVPRPPPGWNPGMGGPPQNMDGPPPGWTGGPPPGWTGGPPSGMGGPPPSAESVSQNSGGAPPGWTGGPPPGWTGGPPPAMSGPPSNTNTTPKPSGGPPPGWTGGPPPGWTGGPPPGFNGQGGPPSGIPPAVMQQMMARMMGGGGSPSPDNEPKMYGMTPVAENAGQLPRAFAEVFGNQAQPQQPSTPQPSAEAPDDEFAELEAATLAAEAEWAEIKSTLMNFHASLDADKYGPMEDHCMPRLDTPFGGPVIYHRTFSIAILHTLYYTALIILERCHPSMPAMSMQAAMVGADRTAHLANIIGRVTAGLFPSDGATQINPARGASLIESTIPLFFAGVQYKERAQREWLKHKLREIHRITGWASASRVLLGCYRAWEVAGEKGLADPFTRPPDSEEEDVPRPEYASREGSPLKGNAEEGKNFILKAAHHLEMAAGLLGEPSDDPVEAEERRLRALRGSTESGSGRGTRERSGGS